MTFDRDNEMDFENRVIAPEYVPEDAEVENPLRPRTFADYVGQEKVKENPFTNCIVRGVKLNGDMKFFENNFCRL